MKMMLLSKSYYKIFQRGIENLLNVSSEGYVAALSTLQNHRTLQGPLGYPFTEIRLVCTKPWHGRQIDIVLMEPLVDELMIASAAQRILVRGTDYRPLQGDNSNMMSTSQDIIKVDRGYLYKYPIYVHDTFHVSIFDDNRMECDDYFGDPGFSSVGNWQYFIR